MRRLWLFGCACLCVLALLSTSAGLRADSGESSVFDAQKKLDAVHKKIGDAPKLGLNLAGLSDWNTELPFVDVFRETRAWISQREGESWGGGPKLALDERGWVTRLEKNCWAEVPLCTIEGGHYPSGIYTIEYAGKGRVEIGGGRVVSDEPGRMTAEIDSSVGSFWVIIKETDPADYIRDIKVYLPGYGEASSREKTGIWNPAFLERWRSMAVFRTMDWQATNGSQQKEWSDRAKPEDATYSRAGMPLELICDFVERIDADLWYCVPDQASDDYVRRAATMMKELLSPKRKIYVEYSNEVWNFSFDQARRAGAKGRELCGATSDWEGAWFYAARRSVEIFKIFEEIFGDDSRLVRILPTQAVNSWVSEQILKFDDAYLHADALAIAPYIGWSVPSEEKDRVLELGVDGVLDRLENEIFPETIKQIQDQKAVADRYGLALVCYESGQHLVGLWGANDSDELNNILISANRTERMGEIYERYFQAWEDVGGNLACHFSSTGKWTKWGSWGLIEYADETPETSPKLRATLKFAEKWNQRR